MSYDLYIFGSAVRGEVEKNSDIDVLVVVDNAQRASMYPVTWSVYTKESIKRYFSEGRLFAWHLYLDAKCIHHGDSKPFIEGLGEPSKFRNLSEDFCSLRDLINCSLNEIKTTKSEIFEIGLIYTALRDIAMLASTKLHDRPCFSRYSPYKLSIELPIPKDLYELMIEARLTSTRGVEFTGDTNELTKMLASAGIMSWVEELEKRL
jgi:hypothetical protein